MADDALQFLAVHLLQQPRGDGDRRVLGVSAGRKSVRRRVVDDVDLGHRHAGGGRHLAHHVVELRRLLRLHFLGVRTRQDELIASVVGPQGAEHPEGNGNRQGSNGPDDGIAIGIADRVADREPEEA